MKRARFVEAVNKVVVVVECVSNQIIDGGGIQTDEVFTLAARDYCIRARMVNFIVIVAAFNRCVISIADNGVFVFATVDRNIVAIEVNVIVTFARLDGYSMSPVGNIVVAVGADNNQWVEINAFDVDSW